MNGFVGMSPVSNEDILYTLAQVATTLAGFSGLVVVFRVPGAQAWSRAELRTFWFLLGDSFLVLFFSLIPLPLALANWSGDALWGLCNALLGSWFVVGDVLAFLGERKDRVLRKVTIVPVITPLLYGMSAAIAPLMAAALWPHVTAKPTRSGARRGTDSRLIRGVNPLCWMSRSDQVVRH
jgi:hypothetical protein